MKKNRKILKSLIFLGIFSLVGMLGMEGFNSNTMSPTIDYTDNNDTLETSIVSQGIKLKLLSTTEHSNVSVTKVFSYQITPSDATIQDITIDLNYVDGESCNEVMTYTHDAVNKTITLTCLADFSKQIQMTLTALDNEKATATITIDYVKKILEINLLLQSLRELEYGVQFDNYGMFDLNYLVAPKYSKYTKDKEYTFKMDATVQTSLTGCSEQFNLGLQQLFEKFIETEMAFPSEEQLWNLCQDTTDMYLLSSLNNTLKLYINGDVYCVEEPSIINTSGFNNNSLMVDIAYGFEDYKTAVESIIVDNPNIEF